MPHFLKEIDLSRKGLKRFGITIFICLFLIGAILMLRHRPAFKVLWPAGLLFLVLAYAFPSILKPIYQIWMILAFCLGWINTRLILGIIFYLVITPIGLISKVFRKDFLDLKWRENKVSYWRKKEPKMFTPESYEKTF